MNCAPDNITLPNSSESMCRFYECPSLVPELIRNVNRIIVCKIAPI